MTIELKPEQEKIIQDEIRRGHFDSVEDVLNSALAGLLAKEQQRKKEIQAKSLAQFLRDSPFYGADLDLSRDPGTDRDHTPPEL